MWPRGAELDCGKDGKDRKDPYPDLQIPVKDNDEDVCRLDAPNNFFVLPSATLNRGPVQPDLVPRVCQPSCQRIDFARVFSGMADEHSTHVL
jgi:hypothetical protein